MNNKQHSRNVTMSLKNKLKNAKTRLKKIDSIEKYWQILQEIVYVTFFKYLALMASISDPALISMAVI